MASKFVWHGLHKQVGQWAKQCISCQKSKVHQHVKSSLQAYPPPIRHFDHVNIDIVGPLPSSQGNRYLLTMVDRFTRWPEAVPLADAMTLSCAQAFLTHWVARCRVPQDISTDRGPQFTSDLWEAFNQLLGIRLHRTTAYHPQANGLVERFLRHLKSTLMARLTGPNWVDALPCTLLGIRTVPKDDLHCSSAELVYGSPLLVPGEFAGESPLDCEPGDLLSWLRARVQTFQLISMSRHFTPSRAVPPSLATADFVFIRKDSHRPPLIPPYEGPFCVLHRGEKVFELDLGGRKETASIDRLKPAYIDSLNRPAMPTRNRRG